MEVIILKNPEEVANKASEIVKNLILRKPSAVLGLATGSTPLLTYKKLIEFHKAKEIDFSRVKTFNLDEYVGLDQNHPASYFSYMKDNFFKHINIEEQNSYIPNGNSGNIPEESQKYEEMIQQAGGIDLQILGIGRDGHIGFNEPSSSLKSRTRLKTLTQTTREDNAQYFSGMDEVPLHVLTMGVGTIMDSKQILLLATGSTKAQAIRQCVEGPITAMCPASVLQFHQKATLLIDEAAAKDLERQEYYHWVYNHKPSWQNK